MELHLQELDIFIPLQDKPSRTFFGAASTVVVLLGVLNVAYGLLLQSYTLAKWPIAEWTGYSITDLILAVSLSGLIVLIGFFFALRVYFVSLKRPNSFDTAKSFIGLIIYLAQPLGVGILVFYLSAKLFTGEVGGYFALSVTVILYFLPLAVILWLRIFQSAPRSEQLWVRTLTQKPFAKEQLYLGKHALDFWMIAIIIFSAIWNYQGIVSSFSGFFTNAAKVIELSVSGRQSDVASAAFLSVLSGIVAILGSLAIYGVLKRDRRNRV